MGVNDMELGPCQVLFGPDGSEVDLGGTQTVDLSITTSTADLKRDQFGDMAYDKVITGHGATVTVNLTDITFANLAVALNQTARTNGSDNAVAGTNKVGTKLRAIAQSLILKKYVSGIVSTDEDDWFIARKAAALAEEVKQTFDATTQRILTVQFYLFFDDSNFLYIFGKESIAS